MHKAGQDSIKYKEEQKVWKGHKCESGLYLSEYFPVLSSVSKARANDNDWGTFQ